jgi:DNA modification methylase
MICKIECLDAKRGQDWALYNADCVQFAQQLPDNSVGFAVYSPPFANLYTYSDSALDMGNCADDKEFFDHYRFLVHEKHRVLKPGRLTAVHCKELVNYAGSSADGMAGLRDFPGEIIRVHQEAGFAYHSRVTIWRDPVTEMQKTKAHGLLWKSLRTDSTFSRQGMAEYVLFFRKWAGEGEAVEPVTHTHEEYPVKKWQAAASPVQLVKRWRWKPSRRAAAGLPTTKPRTLRPWMDIDYTDVLNVRQAREDKDEKHMCPLPLPIIKQCLELYSNPGDVVVSFFAGVGSEGVQSLRMGRKFIGCELKESYFVQGAKNLAEEERPDPQADLFGLLR